RPAWTYTEPAGSMLSRPVVSGTTAFVVSHTLNAAASRLVAVDLSGGSRRWQQTLDGSAYLSPVTADGRVFGQPSKGVFVYAPATGAPSWSIPAPAATTCRAATMVVDGSTLYAFSDRTISAVDTASGTVRWTTEADVHCFTGIAVSNGRL